MPAKRQVAPPAPAEPPVRPIEPPPRGEDDERDHPLAFDNRGRRMDLPAEAEYFGVSFIAGGSRGGRPQPVYSDEDGGQLMLSVDATFQELCEAVHEAGRYRLELLDGSENNIEDDEGKPLCCFARVPPHKVDAVEPPAAGAAGKTASSPPPLPPPTPRESGADALLRAHADAVKAESDAHCAALKALTKAFLRYAVGLPEPAGDEDDDDDDKTQPTGEPPAPRRPTLTLGDLLSSDPAEILTQLGPEGVRAVLEAAESQKLNPPNGVGSGGTNGGGTP